MEIKFEVLLSSSIKRRKPWQRFCWLGKEREGVFLLDDTRISEINLVSGQTKKKTPKLQPLLPRVITMSGSQNGMWLAGILVSGELFLWNRDKDSLKMVMSVPAVYEFVCVCKAASLRLSLLVSGDGRRVLLVTITGQVFLWECLVPQELCSLRDTTVRGRWSQIASSENARLPSDNDKEASLHCLFVQSRAAGDVCLSAFVFTSGEDLIITFLMIQWEEPRQSKLSSDGYSVRWVTKSCPLSDLVPPCRPMKSRGALIPAFSPDGRLLAVILNQKDPRATQALFISTQNFVTVTSLLGGCGSKTLSIPPKYVRSYWVGSVSWAPGGLYLACVLKRGSLLMLARLGGLVSLSTAGCDIEFGPAHFLPLHPLVTYRPPGAPDDGRSSSAASLRDTMRQRYSVTWHPRLAFLIVSDGYMATVLKVPGRPSSAALLSSLLLDVARGLERVRALLCLEQPQVRPRLESMSALKFTASLAALKERETPMCVLPLFLRDSGGTGSMRQTIERAQDDDDHSDSDEGHYTPPVVEDGGRLEFASMFDTLHAQPRSDPDGSGPDDSAALRELVAVRCSLLNAWALGVSLGGAMDQRERLLRYAASCAVRLARMLRIADSAEPGGGAKARCVLDLLRTMLSFLPWDSLHEGGSSCFGVVVDLAGRFARLSLSDGVRSSRSFAAALLVLQEVSKSLDWTYSLPQRAVHRAMGNRPPSLLDTFFIPLFQEAKEVEAVTSQPLLLNRPSKRLVAIWQNMYRQALQYQAELNSHGTSLNQRKERENMWKIISEIQEALQSAGDHLEQRPALHNITGEQHFILGEYHECVQVWRTQLCAEGARAGPRACFLETRYCLALLFAQLFCYRLREAQAMCDSLAYQLQSQSGIPLDDVPEARASFSGTRDDGWLPRQVHREAACAVVQSLGRFMASYFTNQPLAIWPPHSVDVLPPLHLPPSSGRRAVALSQSRAADAVRAQRLSGVWTVDYALELLLLGGLVPEAVWLARSLGDWKTAVSIGLAYSATCRQSYDFSRLKWRELHLPAELQPGCIFQDQLEALVSGTSGSDPDTEDAEELLVSVQEILKASAMAEVDVVSQPLGRLLDLAKERASSLPALVPPTIYLPAPPLYCPQPAPNTQDSVTGVPQATEMEVRGRVAGALQRLLLLLRAARCTRPSARWYVGGLRRCRQLFRKVRKGNVESKDDVLPEGLKKFTNGRGFFRPGGDGDMDTVAKQTIVCFRELCGLCWMLHVREQLTVSCRRYQNARNKSKDLQARDACGAEPSGAEPSRAELCKEALRWACRLLPFSRFLSAEEVLQDLTLSLAAELPPCLTVAEALAAVFPDEEESVRVPLRDKHISLLRRLGHCTVQAPTSATSTRGGEEEEGEVMILLIQDQRRQRVREERRLARSLAPLERHLWEREEEEDRGGGGAILNRFSLGTSLSTSTLTDGEHPLVVSEGDTADTLSESRSPDMQSRRRRSSPGSSKPQDALCRSKDDRKGEEGSKSVNEGTCKVSATEQGDSKDPCLPMVGTWRFELEDEEYPRFLELFLSYVLEKDSLDGEESDLPLLSTFSTPLRQRELHSAAFDVLGTLKRRHAGHRRDSRLPAFRAGRCFHVPPDPPPSTGPSLSVLSETHAVPLGLFGSLRQQAGVTPGGKAPKGGTASVEPCPLQNPLPRAPRTECWPFKAVPHPNVELQLELDSRLEAQFPWLARLLEWMLRWADRSVLLSHSRGNPEVAGEPVVIRAKTSAPAVLSALRLLEQRYTAALLGINTHCDQIQIPQRELTVAPVLQPEPAWKRDRESSLDTGYPASAGTPATLPDLDLQHGPTQECEADEVQEENSDLSLFGHKDVTSDPDVEGEDATRENELLPMAESEVHSSVVESLERDSFGPNISVRIRTQSRTLSVPTDQPLTLSDLEGPKMDDDSESLSEDGGTLNSEPADYSKETASSPARGAPVPASLQRAQQSSAPMPEPLSGAAPALQLPTGTLPQNGAGTHPDPVRQLLQDELFRLVQLQQINFMSLMQVVGASFVNLPLNQSNALLVQHREAAPQATGAPPTASSSQGGPDTGRENADRPTPESEPQSRRSRPTDQQKPSKEGTPCEETSNPAPSGFHTRETHQLTVRSDWPKDSQAEERCLIPPSQGLLTTVENHAPLLEPPSGRSQDCTIFKPLGSTAPGTSGLRLLQLPPPQPILLRPPPPAPVREAWGPTPRRLNLSEHKPVMEVNRMRANPSAPPQHLNHDQHIAQSLIPEASSEKGTGGDAVRLPPAPHTAVPTVGIPLLRFPPATEACPIQLPRLPLAAPARHPMAGPAVMGPYPRLQLLHAEPEPQSTVWRYSAPPARAPRLLPLEELVARAAAVGRGADRKLQLLTVDYGAKSEVAFTPSSKRLKRREERKRKQKPRVSFRPEDSILPSPQPEEGGPALDDGYVLPLGSFDSMLSGQRLLNAAHSTSAELHAFAATCRRPPEIQDASTSTDPDPPRIISDEAVPAQLPMTPDPSAAHGRQGKVAPVVPPDVFLNLRFPGDDPADQPNAQTIAVGRRFISVIDLEDGSLLQDLPPATPPTHTESNAPPTSAQLHLLAASVTNPAPAKLEVDPCLDLSTAEQNDEARGRSVTVSPPTVVRSESGAGGDSPSSRLLTDGSFPDEALLAQRSVSRECFSSRLSEMDARLAALQNIADHMDREFANTRLLVNTIEALTPVAMTSEDNEPHSSPLSITKEGKRYGHTVHHELGRAVEETEVPRLGGVSSSTLGAAAPPDLRGRSSLTPATASSQRSAPRTSVAPTVKPEQHLWVSSQELTEPLMENSVGWAGDALALTGLSDVADILGELVREGALSPSDLQPSPSAAMPSSSRRGMVEEERKELRAWMRRRQRERLVEYRRQREEKREQERKPFTPHSSVKPSSRDLTINRKTKEERDKQVLLEHHSLRAREACSLITDLLSAPLPLRPASNAGHAPPPPPDSGPGLRSRSQSMERSRKTPTSRRGRARSAVALGRTVVLQKRAASHSPSTLSARLGLHRPASALPGDRLSQVTRRGMVAETRARPRVKTSTQRPKTGPSRFPAEQKTMGWRESSLIEDTEEREVVSPWDVPPEIRRILALESTDKGQSLLEEDWDRLDTLSQSTGSMLSKLDWAAIEKIVAEEEEV